MDLAQNTLAIVDDDADILLSVKLFLKRYFQEVFCFSHPDELFYALHEKSISIDIVLLDLNYQNGKNDGEEGIKALEKLKSTTNSIEVIVMTAYAEVQTAVDAVKKGAFDFIVKPWQNEKLLVSIMNAAQKKTLSEELSHKKLILDTTREELSPIIGESNSMQMLRELIDQIAPTNASIFIKGESGTGKELIARHIHKQSSISDQPFVTVDFASIPNELQMESLFGNSTSTMGKWLAAKGGCLFLKNVSAMDASVQEHIFSYFPLHKNSPKRIISSLKDETQLKYFNPNLLYRLNTIEVKVPTLNERNGDFYELSEYFLEQHNNQHHKAIKFLEPTNKEIFSHYAWKGNIKELNRAIERAVLINQNSFTIRDLLPSNISQRENRAQKLEEIERQHIEKVLVNNQMNIQKSAAELGISRAALYRRIEKYKLAL